LSLDREWRGVIVVAVERGSIADRARFARGDILLEINGRNVNTVAELMAALSRPANRWHITYRRDGEVHAVVIG